MRREHRHHFHAVAIVPLRRDQITYFEKIGKQGFVNRHQRRELLGDRVAHQRRGVVLDAHAGRNQRGQPGEMVIVRVGVEHAGNFAHIDAEALQRVQHAGAGIDEVIAALKHDDARHALAAQVPAVALAAVDHAKILRLDKMLARRVRRFVGLARREVEIHLCGAALVSELVTIDAEPPCRDTAAQRHRLFAHNAAVEQVFTGTDAAKGKPQFERHLAARLFGIEPGGAHFFLAHQAIVAAVNVVKLGTHLRARADDHRPAPGVVRVVRQDHALAVEHLQHRELGQVGEAPVLNQHIREQNHVRPGLNHRAADTLFGNIAAQHQVFDHVGRRAAQNIKACLRHLDPVDARRHPRSAQVVHRLAQREAAGFELGGARGHARFELRILVLHHLLHIAQFEMQAHPGEQYREVQGFIEIVHRARLQPALLIGGFGAVGTHQNHRGARQRGVSVEQRAHLVTAHPRHDHVTQHEVRLLAPCQRQRLARIVAHHHIMHGTKLDLEQLGQRWIIVDRKDLAFTVLGGHACSRESAAARPSLSQSVRLVLLSCHHRTADVPCCTICVTMCAA